MAQVNPAADAPGGDIIPFAEWWRSLLEALGISQEEGARRVGVSRNTSQRWAGGQVTPRYGELIKIARAFGVLPPFRPGRKDTRV